MDIVNEKKTTSTTIRDIYLNFRMIYIKTSSYKLYFRKTDRPHGRLQNDMQYYKFRTRTTNGTNFIFNTNYYSMTYIHYMAN